MSFNLPAQRIKINLIGFSNVFSIKYTFYDDQTLLISFC